MRGEKKILSGAAGCVIGAVLQGVFLISDRMMRSPVEWADGVEQYKFNIGFHWTTILGMLGVVLLVLGIQRLLNMENHVLGAVASAAFLIHISSWEFFVHTSKTYVELVLEWNTKIMWVYEAAKMASVICMLLLLGCMVLKRKGMAVEVLYRVLSIVVLILSMGCLIFKTLCNQWYLVQAAVAIAGVWGMNVYKKKKILDCKPCL